MRGTLRRTALRALLVAGIVLPVAAAAPAGAASTASYPVNWSTTAAVASGAAFDVPPAGANRPSCTPSPAHPRPVVLVHGATANQNIAWQALAPTLANQGYCVYTLTYGQTWYSGNLGGIDDIYRSSRQLASYVETVRQRTGAAKVDLVGHSEGGNLIRQYIKRDGGADKVSSYVSLGGVNLGPPTASGLLTVAQQIPGATELIETGCPACGQLLDPAFFAELNTPSATVPGVTYTAIASTRDEVVTPTGLAYLPAGPNVTNKAIQDVCPDDPVGHLGLTYDRAAVAMVGNALDPGNPRPVPCGSGFPL